MMFTEDNKNQIAVVTIGYNRLDSTKRLFNSLLKADYSRYDKVPFVACVDCSNCQPLYDYVNNFDWPYGDKYVIIQTERQGLKKHIFKCGDLVEHFRGVVIFEDDTYVAKNFYNYVSQAVDYYENDDAIASIALYVNGMDGFCWLPNCFIKGESDVFLSKFVCSSGECYTRKMWQDFRKWHANNEEPDWGPIDLPQQEKDWARAWTKYFDAYMAITGKYSIYPYISLSTNFGDAGDHSSLSDTLVQEPLLYGTMDYRFKPSSELITYYAQGSAELPKALGIPYEDLCIDLSNYTDNVFGKRYYLTFKKLPYKVVKSFGVMLRPLELNVIDNIEGNDFFLYDTSVSGPKPKGRGLDNLIVYHLHGFNYRYLIRGLYLRTIMLAKKAWGKIMKKLLKK